MLWAYPPRPEIPESQKRIGILWVPAVSRVAPGWSRRVHNWHCASPTLAADSESSPLTLGPNQRNQRRRHARRAEAAGGELTLGGHGGALPGM